METTPLAPPVMASHSSRVLIVDDDPIVSEAYRLALSRWSYTIEHAGTAADALRRILADDVPPLALIVLDLGLPDMDGLELMALVRERHDRRTLPIIVVTGAEGLPSRLDGLDGGANDYLVKPVALAELAARVNAQVRIVDNWRAAISEVSDTRRQIARDLGRLGPGADVDAAARVMTDTAQRIADVAGAAFIMGHDPLVVMCAQGNIPLAAGDAVSGELAAMLERRISEPEIRDSANLRFGETRPLLAVPVFASARRVGMLAVAVRTGLERDRHEAVTGALSDLAAMAAPLIGSPFDRVREVQRARNRQQAIIDQHSFSTVFQPIVHLKSGVSVGYEALTRFESGARPDLVFADAANAGLREELEKATARAALLHASSLPDHAYVSVNLSAPTMLDTDFLRELSAGARPIVVELTEHDSVEEYGALRDALSVIRDRIRLAVDDTGAGFASLSHIRELRPDVIKLDRSLVRGIDVDLVGRAMIAGMVHFADEAGSDLIGEGIETNEELRVLCSLGVRCGQGYLLGAPAPIVEIVADGHARLE